MGPRLKNLIRVNFPSPYRYETANPRVGHNEAGQVFMETIRTGASMSAEWKWRTRGSTREYENYRSRGPGCSTLFDMAIRSCLMYSYDITGKVLEEVPERLGKTLWSQIVTAQLDSLQVFLAFACLYPSVASRKRLTISRPNLPLETYLKAVTSPSFAWLTNLTLSNLTVTRTALIQLSSLENLGALTIGPAVNAPDIGFDDAIIRTWSRAATTTHAFSTLRVLCLRAQDLVTFRVFEYLSVFPALAVFACENSGSSGVRHHPIAARYAWNYMPQHVFESWLAKRGEAQGMAWDSVLQTLFRLGSTFTEANITAEGVAAIAALPVVHLEVGGHADDPSPQMRCWYRENVVEQHVRPESVAAIHGTKRGLDPDGKSAVQRKPMMRSSKRQYLGAQVLGFGS